MSEITPNTPNPVREDAYKQQLAAKLGIDQKYIPGSPIWHSEEEIAAIAEMFSNMAGGGSGGGVLIVHMSEGALDKTWAEIAEAVHEKPVLILAAMGYTTTILYVVSVTQAQKPGMKHYVTAFSPATDFASSICTFVADTYSDYPAIQE